MLAFKKYIGNKTKLQKYVVGIDKNYSVSFFIIKNRYCFIHLLELRIELFFFFHSVNARLVTLKELQQSCDYEEFLTRVMSCIR